MTITSINPSTGEIIQQWPWMTTDDIADVLTCAHAAYLEHKQSTLAERGAWLCHVADDFEQHLASWASSITLAMGKPKQAAEREVLKSAEACRYFAAQAPEALVAQDIRTNMQQSTVHIQPLGVLLAIMPWNYPLWQIVRFMAPNMMLGNTFLLSHAPIVTAIGERLQNTFATCDCHQGVFQVMRASHAQIATVIQDQRVAGVSFTGSDRVGGIVAGLAGQALKPSVIECGGNDPYVVLADADVDHAAKTCVAMRLANSGQVCISAKRIIVVKAVYEAFLARVMAYVSDYTMGDPCLETTQMGPMARADLREHVHQQVQSSIAEGAVCLCGGVLPQGEGFYYPATVLTKVTSAMTVFREEVFGPVIALIQARDEAHAITLANDSDFGLGAAVFTQDVDRGAYLAREAIEAGFCMVNEGVSSDVRLPFGGIKRSGYGRELGMPGFYSFANIKTIGVA